MREIDGNWLEWLKMAENAENGWKWLEIAENGLKWLEMAEMAINSWKWMEWLEMAGNG